MRKKSITIKGIKNITSPTMYMILKDYPEKVKNEVEYDFENIILDDIKSIVTVHDNPYYKTEILFKNARSPLLTQLTSKEINDIINN